MTRVRKTIEKGYGVPPDVPDIFEAAANDDVDALKIALQYYDINITDENDMTPLHHASGALAFNTAAHLVADSNVDTTLQDKFGREAAIMAEEILGMGNPKADKMRDLIWKTSDDDLAQDNPVDNIGEVLQLKPD